MTQKKIFFSSDINAFLFPFITTPQIMKLIFTPNKTNKLKFPSPKTSPTKPAQKMRNFSKSNDEKRKIALGKLINGKKEQEGEFRNYLRKILNDIMRN